MGLYELVSRFKRFCISDDKLFIEDSTSILKAMYSFYSGIYLTKERKDIK